MIGLSRLITARALAPRRDRISVRSRSRIRLTAALLGLISSLPWYRRTLNPRKSKPSSRVTTRVLSSLKARPLGASQAASRALTSSASSLEWHKATRVVGVSDQHRGARHRLAGIRAGRSVADSGGLLHPVQGDVQQHGADHPALRSSLLGAGQSTVLDHARLQPLPDHSPGGERAEHGQKVVVGDPVERRRPGQRRAPTAASGSCPWRSGRWLRSRHGSRGRAGIRRTSARTAPPTRAPAH